MLGESPHAVSQTLLAWEWQACCVSATSCSTLVLSSILSLAPIWNLAHSSRQHLGTAPCSSHRQPPLTFPSRLRSCRCVWLHTCRFTRTTTSRFTSGWPTNWGPSSTQQSTSQRTFTPTNAYDSAHATHKMPPLVPRESGSCSRPRPPHSSVDA